MGWGKLFQASSTREAIGAVEHICSVQNTPAAAKVADMAKSTIANGGRIKGPVPPPLLAVQLVQFICEQQLTRGQHHIYRGILSAYGADLLSLYESCVDYRMELGDPEVDGSTAARWKADLRIELNGMG